VGDKTIRVFQRKPAPKNTAGTGFFSSYSYLYRFLPLQAVWKLSPTWLSPAFMPVKKNTTHSQGF